MDEALERSDDWAWRPWLLAGLGATAGLLIHLIMGEDRSGALYSSLQMSSAMFVGCFAILVGYTLERARWQWSLAFSLAAALIIALVAWWNGAPDDWSAAETWRMVCAFLSIAIAAPLFQTARDHGGWRFPYPEVHGHAWTNVVMWCASAAFVGVAFLLTFMLSELFSLIGIRLIKNALDAQWFALLLIGTALGAAVGVFRKRDGIMRLLLKVVVAVLGVLAPVLGAGLLLFLASLPFTGLSALWDATRETTPILLSCVIGALILANVVIGNSEEDENRYPPLRWGAMALALAALPLAVIAAISTGARIQQYGFTPDRLWALTFVIVASAFGLTYLVALVRGRMDWARFVRPANLKLAFGLCGLALFLALPILSFNAISTRDQVARLESGRTAPDKFDWAALRFDFGEPGKAAVQRLTKSGNAAVRTAALRNLKAKDRWDLLENQRKEARKAAFLRSAIRVRPVQVPLPDDLRQVLAGDMGRNMCEPYEPEEAGSCTLFWQQGAGSAIVMRDGCDRPDLPAEKRIDPAIDCGIHFNVLVRVKGKWTEAADHPFDRSIERADPSMTLDQQRASLAAERAAIDRGDVEIRTVTRRQLFVADKPASGIFE